MNLRCVLCTFSAVLIAAGTAASVSAENVVDIFELKPIAIDFENNVYSIRVENKSACDFEGVSFYAAYYERDGRLAETGIYRKYAVESGQSFSIILPISDKFDSAGAVKLMMWDEKGNPLMKAVNIKIYDKKSFAPPMEDAEMPFSDIDADNAYCEAILVMNREFGDVGFFNGYEDGEYKPSGHIMRSELCHILTGFAGVDFKCSAVCADFADVPDSHWAKNVIAYAVQKGLISEEEGYFYPNRYVQLNEVLTAFLKMLGEADVSAEDAVKSAVEYGLLTNANSEEFEITRGNFTQIAYNFAKIYNK